MRPPLRTTHTFVKLEVSAAAFDEIQQKLVDADYGQCFIDDAIEMSGIGIVRSGDPSSLTVRELQQAGTERSSRWHDGAARPWTLLEWAGAMCGEAGEAANVAKKILRIDLGTGGNEAAEHVITDRAELVRKLAAEIAGTILYAERVATEAGIDLERALIDTFNEKSIALGFPDRLPLADSESVLQKCNTVSWVDQIEHLGGGESDIHCQLPRGHAGPHRGITGDWNDQVVTDSDGPLPPVAEALESQRGKPLGGEGWVHV